MSISIEDRPMAYTLLKAVGDAWGEWGPEDIKLIAMEEENRVEKFALLIILSMDGYIAFEPVSKLFGLTDKGADFVENYDPTTGCVHNWAEDETGAEPPYDICTNCGERRH